MLVRPDGPPAVRLTGPDNPRAARADDTRVVAPVARDDVAVAAAEIHSAIRRAGSGAPAEPGQVAARRPGLGTPTVRDAAPLGLAPLKLQPDDSVSDRMRVAANRPAPRGAERGVVAGAGPHDRRPRVRLRNYLDYLASHEE